MQAAARTGATRTAMKLAAGATMPWPAITAAVPAAVVIAAVVIANVVITTAQADYHRRRIAITAIAIAAIPVTATVIGRCRAIPRPVIPAAIAVGRNITALQRQG
jgi:hypothetical protein